jgi:hypothetical protein
VVSGRDLLLPAPRGAMSVGAFRQRYIDRLSGDRMRLQEE